MDFEKIIQNKEPVKAVVQVKNEPLGPAKKSGVFLRHNT
jgi:hypothetical protein